MHNIVQNSDFRNKGHGQSDEVKDIFATDIQKDGTKNKCTRMVFTSTGQLKHQI